MAFGETRLHREEREARQRDLYPELALSEPDGIFAVDRLRREESRPLTSVGMAVESVMVRSRPPIVPDDDAEGVFSGLIRDPLPQPRAPSLPPVERLPAPQQTRPAFEIGPNLEPLSIERTRRELATRGPLPGAAPLEDDALSDFLDRESRRRNAAELTGVSQPSGPPGGIQSALLTTLSGAPEGKLTDPNPLRTAFELLDRSSQAALGAFTGENPVESIRQALQGVMESQPERFSGLDVGFVRNASDKDIIGSLSLRDIGGGVAEFLLSPEEVLPGGILAGFARRGVVKGVKAGIREAGEQAPDIARVAGEIVETARSTGPLLPGEAVARAEIVPGAGDLFERAKDALRRALDEEEELRQTGIAGGEIAAGRARQAANIREGLQRAREANLTPEIAAREARIDPGPLRQTFAQPVQVDIAARDGMFAELNRQLETGVIGAFQHRNVRTALESALSGRGLQPAQIRDLRRFVGDDIAEAILARSSQNQMITIAARIGRRGRGGTTGGGLPSTAPSLPSVPSGAPPVGTGVRARPQAMRVPPPPIEPERIPIGLGVAPARRFPSGRGPGARPPTPEAAVPVLPSAPSGIAGVVGRRSRAVATQPLQRAEEVAESQNRLLEQILDVWNIPRSIKSSFDVSAWLRQGGLLGAKNMDAWTAALGPSLRALRNPEEARIILDQIQNGPKALIRNRAGVFFAEITDPNLQVRRLGDQWAIVNRETDQSVALFRTKADAEARLLPKLTQREEQFISRIASKIPGVGASERSFVVFLNKLRADVFDKFAAELSARNAEWWEYEELGRMVNVFTGRGTLPKGHSEIISLLGNTFWSQRMVISRFEAPLLLASKSPLVRREAAYSLGAWAAERMAVLGLGAMLGLWTVELNPRSSDFGKIKLPGGIRIDPWGGFQQMVVFAARLASGQIATTGSGNLFDVDRWELAWNFVRGKLSPSAATAVNIKEGKNIIGEPVTPTTVVRDLTIPLNPQDFWEGYQFGGIPGAAIAGTAGTVGFGAQSFQSFADLQMSVAADLFPGKSLDELNRGERRQINADPRMQERIGSFEEDLGTPQQQLSFAFDNLDRVKTEAEAGLRAVIDADAAKPVLKEAIKSLKQTRFIASDALLGSDALQVALERTDQPVEDVLAEAYWSIDVQVDPGTGDIDFDTRDEERAAILQEAGERGVDLNYITGAGEGTYRGTRFADERVREAVEEYESLLQALADSKFFDIRDVVWANIIAQNPSLAQFETVDALEDAIRGRLAEPPFNLPRNSADSKIAVKKAMDANEHVQQWREVSNDIEEQWINAFPELARRAFEWDYLRTLRKDEEAVILGAATP